MSTLNPLNDISRTYLDTIAKMNKKEEETEVKRWEGELNLQMKTMANLSKEDKDYGYDSKGNSLNPADMEEKKKKDDDLAGAPNKNGKNGKKKKRWWDDDGDGKGYEDHEVKKEDAQYGYDSKGRSKNPADVEKRKRKEDKLFGAPLKKEAFSSWRDDLREIVSAHPMTDVETEKEVTEKKGIKNKVIINPKMSEAVAEIGGQVISETEVDLQEKKDKDTPDQVKAVIAYDRARHATDDATYDTMHGKKKQAKKERDYAKWQRDTGARDAQKSGHPWEHEKYGTREKEGKKSVKHAHVKDSVEYILDNLHNLNESDIADILARLEKKRIRQGGNPDESPLGKKTGRAMKAKQDEGRKKAGVSEGVLGKKTKSIVSKEVKELEKSLYTMKDKNVVKADKTDTPNYKGYKFGVKEAKDWIQGAVKRPGAFTRKAKAAGMSVQQFAKTVDDNPNKYSTRTKRQANLAQTFASMKKEDVEEMIFNYIAESHENA